MPRFWPARQAPSGTLPKGTQVLVINGTNAGHMAEIRGVTAKMYHLRLDNNVMSRAKHENVTVMEEDRFPSSPRRVQTPITGQPRREAHSGTLTAGRRRQHTREQRETQMMESLAEIQRHTAIVAECAEELRKMNLEE